MPYPSIHAAINDCYDLSYAMALKAYFLNVAYGGSKCVVYNPNQLPFETIAPYLGEAINQLEGRYIASIDIGTGCKEIDLLSKYTSHIYGTSNDHDPSKFTAQGVIETLKVVFSKINKPMQTLTVSIQGLGKVGSIVCNFCLDNGIQVYGSDINQQRLEPYLQHPKFKPVDVSDILSHPCDVLIPAASGNVINSENISSLNTKYICSIANNPIANPMLLSNTLTKKGIVFLPDFLTNAGGVLHVANALETNDSNKKPIQHISKMISNLLKQFPNSNLYTQAIKLFNEQKHIG